MEALVERTLLENYNKYYRMAYSYVKNEADAGDIVQEGAYKAIRNASKLEDAEFVDTWIYRIMLNETFALLRNRKKVDFLEDKQIEEAASDKHEDIDLQRALESLDAKDQAVIKLKFFEEYRLTDIADVLDENISTVKSRLYRGLKKLRIELDDYQLEDE